jgi:hypothetical protein
VPEHHIAGVAMRKYVVQGAPVVTIRRQIISAHPIPGVDLISEVVDWLRGQAAPAPALAAPAVPPAPAAPPAQLVAPAPPPGAPAAAAAVPVMGHAAAQAVMNHTVGVLGPCACMSGGNCPQDWHTFEQAATFAKRNGGPGGARNGPARAFVR